LQPSPDLAFPQQFSHLPHLPSAQLHLPHLQFSHLHSVPHEHFLQAQSLHLQSVQQHPAGAGVSAQLVADIYGLAESALIADVPVKANTSPAAAIKNRIEIIVFFIKVTF
jgi:hypothetical protein